MRVEIKLDATRVRDAFRRLTGAVDDLRPALVQIGEALVESTKRRFLSSEDPEGHPWRPNAEATVRAFLEARAGRDTARRGERVRKISAAEVAAAALTKRPLIAEGHLATQIFYRVDGPRRVLIGTPLNYAAPQQFGAKRGSLGRDRRGRPVPWGDIPPRPFLGISRADADEITHIIEEYLASMS